MHDCIKTIQQLFVIYGDKHYQEACSQTVHAVSCAWHAKKQHATADLIVAALLHDIGHFIADRDNISGFDQFGHKEHAEIGATWLAQQGFPPSVYLPIRYHVQAKRYLASQRQLSKPLSHASATTLAQQGGIMTESEQARFELQPYFNDAIALRAFDELGKPTEKVSTAISYWLPYVEFVLGESLKNDALSTN